MRTISIYHSFPTLFHSVELVYCVGMHLIYYANSQSGVRLAKNEKSVDEALYNKVRNQQVNQILIFWNSLLRPLRVCETMLHSLVILPLVQLIPI